MASARSGDGGQHAPPWVGGGKGGGFGSNVSVGVYQHGIERGSFVVACVERQQEERGDVAPVALEREGSFQRRCVRRWGIFPKRACGADRQGTPHGIGEFGGLRDPDGWHGWIELMWPPDDGATPPLFFGHVPERCRREDTHVEIAIDGGVFGGKCACGQAGK